MALVEAPIAHHWDPVAVGGVESDICGADSATQKRGIQDVGQNAFLREQLAAALGFCLTLFGQIYIDPASELVGLVPLGLAMAKKNQFSVSHASSMP